MPPTANAAAKDQQYLSAYATVCLFFFQELSVDKLDRALEGKWPRDHQEFANSQALVNNLMCDICTLMGINRASNNACFRNSKKLRNIFHPDKYHCRALLISGDFANLDWRALFAFSTLGDLFFRLSKLCANEDCDSREYVFPVPLFVRSFNPVGTDAATPFDCTASRSFSSKVATKEPNNPHVMGRENNLTRLFHRNAARRCYRAFRDRNAPTHAFGTFHNVDGHANEFMFDAPPAAEMPPEEPAAQPDDTRESAQPNQHEVPQPQPAPAPVPQPPPPTSDASSPFFTNSKERASQELLHQDPLAVVDHFTVRQCVGSESYHFHEARDIPRSLQGAWATALGHACEELTDATNNSQSEDHLLRRVKWFFLLPILILRKPPSGKPVPSVSVKTAMSRRLAMWMRRDFQALIAEYEEDILLLANLNDAHREPTKEKREDKNTQRCMEHISKGHVGKGAAALLSKGTSNPHNPTIQQQLHAKHPSRKEDIPLPSDEQLLNQCAELDEKEFKKQLRALDNRVAGGIEGSTK